MSKYFPLALFLLFSFAASAQNSQNLNAKAISDSLARIDSIRTYMMQGSLNALNAMQAKIEAQEPDGKGGYKTNQQKAGEAQNLFVQSRFYYRKVLSFDQNHYQAWSSLGTTYYFEGLVKNSVPYFAHSVQLNSSYAQGWYNLGKAYQQLGRKDSAVIAMQQCIRSDSTYQSAYVEYSKMLLEQNDTAKAFSLLRTIIRINPRLELPWTTMATAYFQMNDSIHGIAAMEQAARVYQPNVERLDILSSYFARHGDPEKSSYYARLAAVERKLSEIPKD